MNPKEKLEQFEKDKSNGHQPIVFCVQCGSTIIDQNFSNQIRCYNCNNHSIWDSDKFSIAREGNHHDAISAFKDIEERKVKLDDGEWSDPITSSLLPLLHTVCSTTTEISDRPRIMESDFKKLTELWSEAKVKVDSVFESLLRSDGISPDLE